MSAPLVTETRSHENRLLTLSLNAPPGNILDRQMIAALGGALELAATDDRLVALVLDHAGKHFSFGASVEEHLPGEVEGMLTAFHALGRRLASFPLPLLAVVRGRCLGGALEVAALATRIFAGTDAKLGQPEMQLGVFAPIASALLPERIGMAAAQDLLLSGRVVDAQEALDLGLVDDVSDDPAAAAVTYAEQHLLSKSAFSLRHATEAVKRSWREQFERDLERLERLYLEQLMAGEDPREGLQAFLDKRQPTWRDR